jgi:O-antigen/teichoic acid export membrane protein
LGQDSDSTPVKSKIVDSVKKYLVIALAFWTASFIVLYLVLPYINAFTQKEAMQDFILLFPIIFAGQMFFSFGAVIQYGLYALNRDRELAFLAAQYFVLSVTLLTFLIPLYGSVGAASAMCLASLFMFLGRVRQLFNN